MLDAPALTFGVYGRASSSAWLLVSSVGFEPSAFIGKCPRATLAVMEPCVACDARAADESEDRGLPPQPSPGWPLSLVFHDGVQRLGLRHLSGLQAGWRSSAGSLVSRVTPEPSAFIT